jgi:hypothetical protein
MFRSTYVVCNFLMNNLIEAMILLKMVLITTLKEEIMLMNAIINLMILFICQNFPRCMIQIVILLNFSLVIATIIKEEVMSALYMKLIIISCTYLL